MKRTLLLALTLAACSGEKDATVRETAISRVASPVTVPTPAVVLRRTPLPRDARKFGDWAVVCEGRIICTAVSLPPQNIDHDRYEVRVSRRAASRDIQDVTIRALGNRSSDEVTLAINDKVFVAGVLQSGQVTTFAFMSDPEEFARARTMLVYDARNLCEGFCPPAVVPRYYIPKTKAPPYQISLTGSRAALDYMERRLQLTE